MYADTAPDGALVFAKNGAGAAGRPAVYDLVYPVPVRFLVANADRQCIPCVGRLLSRKYLCGAGPGHAGIQLRARLCLLAPVFADAAPAVAAALCRALAVANLRPCLYDGDSLDLAAPRDHLDLYRAPYPLAAAYPAAAAVADPPAWQAAIC